jgi:starvation-inducible outer membrane lipoprotein
MKVETNMYILETCSSLPKAMGKEGERKRSSCEKAYNNNYKKQQSERTMVEG